MATSYVSPGLYVRESDKSAYVSSLSGTRLGIVTTASWGPVNEATLVTSSESLFNTFGPLTGATSYSDATDTYPEMPGLYAAERYFRRGRIAYIVRVGSTTGDNALATAYSYIPGTSTTTSVPSTSTIYPALSATPAPATIVNGGTTGEFTAGYYSLRYTWSNSIGESLASEPVTHHLTATSFQFTPPALPTLAGGAHPTHFNVYVSAMCTTPVLATAASSWLHAGTFKWTNIVTNDTPDIPDAVDVKLVPTDRSSDCLKVEALYPGTYGDRIRVRVVPSGRSTRAAAARRVVVLVAPTYKPNSNMLQAQQVEAFDGVQFNSRIEDSNNNLVDNPNTALNRINDGMSNYIKVSLIDPVSDITDERFDSANSDDLETLNFDVDSQAAKSNYSGSLRAGDYNVAFSTVLVDTRPDIVTSGMEYESFSSDLDDVTIESTSGSAIAFSLSFPAAPSNYARTCINIYCCEDGGALKLVGSAPIVEDSCTGLITGLADQQVPEYSLGNEVGHVELGGGANGVPESTDSNAWIGTPGDDVSPATGLQIFRNREAVAISLLATPGIYHSDVVNEIIDIAEVERGDCLAIIDPPPNLTPNQVIQWHNGQSGLSSSPTVALNSSYAALFWPWCQIADSYNSVSTVTGVRGQKLFLPPSSFAIEAIAFTDLISDPWFAPAGLTRGRITGITGVQYKPTQGDRDVLYSGGNAVNSIATFNQTGVAIWGQRTLQRIPTALDRINVRRLMIYLRERIQASVLTFVFEQNNESLWLRFKDTIDPFMRSVRNGQGITDYKIVMDSSTNPPEIIEQNMARGLIYVKPTKTAEIIVLDFVVTNQTSSFNEAIA